MLAAMFVVAPVAIAGGAYVWRWRKARKGARKGAHFTAPAVQEGPRPQAGIAAANPRPVEVVTFRPAVESVRQVLPEAGKYGGIGSTTVFQGAGRLFAPAVLRPSVLTRAGESPPLRSETEFAEE